MYSFLCFMIGEITILCNFIHSLINYLLEFEKCQTQSIFFLFILRYFTSLISQLFARSLSTEDQECFSQLFVSLHKSQLLTADMFIKVGFMFIYMFCFMSE